MKVADIRHVALQAADEKVADLIFAFADQADRCVEKLRKDDEIHGDILFAGGKDLLCGVLAQQQQLARLERYFRSVYDMHGFSLAHIDHFYIVMRVLRKVHKARVRAERNQLSLAQKKSAVYLGGVLVHIDAAVDSAAAGEQIVFFGCDRFQLV